MHACMYGAAQHNVQSKELCVKKCVGLPSVQGLSASKADGENAESITTASDELTNLAQTMCSICSLEYLAIKILI